MMACLQNSCMLDKDHLERWCVAWDLVCENLEMPLSQELFEVLLEVWSEGPWAVARGAGLPFHHLMDASMAFSERVRKGS